MPLRRGFGAAWRTPVARSSCRTRSRPGLGSGSGMVKQRWLGNWCVAGWQWAGLRARRRFAGCQPAIQPTASRRYAVVPRRAAAGAGGQQTCLRLHSISVHQCPLAVSGVSSKRKRSDYDYDDDDEGDDEGAGGGGRVRGSGRFGLRAVGFWLCRRGGCPGPRKDRRLPRRRSWRGRRCVRGSWRRP